MTERWVDLRSDTVTQPTEAMRAAMMAALVGDFTCRKSVAKQSRRIT